MYSCSLRQAPPYTCYARPSKKKKPLGQIRGQNPQHAQTTSDEWVWLILKTRLVGLSWVCFCLLRIWPRLDNLTFSLNYIEQDLVGMSLNFTNSFQCCQKKKWFTVIFSSSISNPDQNYEHSKKPSTHLGADIDIYFEDFENRQRRLIQEAMTIFCFLLNRCLNEYWSGTFAELWWC